MNKCSFKINMFAFLIITALLNTVVCSKISLVDESFREEGSQSRLAGFCSIGAATEGYLRTDYSSKILLLLKLLFFIDVFELAISPDYHSTSVVIVQGVIFFRLKMPVNLNQYRATIGVFNNRNLITNKIFLYFTESNNVRMNPFPAINVMVYFFFFFMFVVSVHQKNRKIRF